MDEIQATLIGAIVGAAAALLGSLLSNLLTIYKDRDLWLRERKSEQFRWLRERLQEIYTNAIHYSSLLLNKHQLISDKEYSLSKDERREWLDDFSNTQKWLGLLLAYYPEPRNDAFKMFHEQVVQLSKKTQPDLWLTEHLRNQVIELASHDPRLNIKE